MATKKVITPTDLDNTTVQVNGSNKVEAVQPTIAASVTSGNKIADITPAGELATSLYETITTLAKNGENTVRMVGEDGTNNDATVIESLSLAVDAVAKTLKVTVNGVGSADVDISAFYADVNVDTVDYTPGTYVLKLAETDGTEHTIDLSSLVGVTVGNGLTGDGTTTTPLAVEADATVTGNLVSVASGGVSVAPGDVRSLADVELQDMAGNTLLHGFSTNN